jgi:hypothetical protein
VCSMLHAAGIQVGADSQVAAGEPPFHAASRT